MVDLIITLRDKGSDGLYEFYRNGIRHSFNESRAVCLLDNRVDAEAFLDSIKSSIESGVIQNHINSELKDLYVSLLHLWNSTLDSLYGGSMVTSTSNGFRRYGDLYKDYVKLSYFLEMNRVLEYDVFECMFTFKLLDVGTVSLVIEKGLSHYKKS